MLVLVSAFWLFVRRVGLLSATPMPLADVAPAPLEDYGPASPSDNNLVVPGNDVPAPSVIDASDNADVVAVARVDDTPVPLVDDFPVPLVFFSRISHRVGYSCRFLRPCSSGLLVIETGLMWVITSRNEVQPQVSFAVSKALYKVAVRCELWLLAEGFQ